MVAGATFDGVGAIAPCVDAAAWVGAAPVAPVVGAPLAVAPRLFLRMAGNADQAEAKPVELDAGGAGTTEDDVTMKLMVIIDVNDIVRKGLGEGAAVPALMEHWDFLQVQCAM